MCSVHKHGTNNLLAFFQWLLQCHCYVQNVQTLHTKLIQQLYTVTRNKQQTNQTNQTTYTKLYQQMFDALIITYTSVCMFMYNVILILHELMRDTHSLHHTHLQHSCSHQLPHNLHHTPHHQ